MTTKLKSFRAHQRFSSASEVLAWCRQVREVYGYVPHHGSQQAEVVDAGDVLDKDRNPTGSFILYLRRGNDFKEEHRAFTFVVTAKQAETALWASGELETLNGGQKWLSPKVRAEREKLLK